MNILKLAIVAGVIGFAYNHWWKPSATAKAVTVTVASVTANGFLTMPPVAGGYGREVLIVAPVNCSADGARRADELASELSRRKIPIARSNNFSFNFIDAPPGAVDRILDIGRGEVPIVFVGGKVKANPSLDEVLTEFSATRL